MKSVEVRQENKERWETYITSGGLRKTKDIIADLLEDGTIDENGLVKKSNVTKAQKEGIALLLQVLPYFKGKQGNVDKKGDTIPTNINILQTTTDDLQRILEAGSSNGTG